MSPGPGLTQDHLVGQDFIQVRPGLIRLLGGDAAAAVVLQRIAWRAEWHGEERDGHVWYRASCADLGSDTGLSKHQVSRLVTKLREKGFIEGRALDDAAGDQTLWYRLVFSDGGRTEMVPREPRRPDQQIAESRRSRPPVDNSVGAQGSDLQIAKSRRSQPAAGDRSGIATVTVAESQSLLSLQTSRDKTPPTPGAAAPGECRRHVDKPGVNCRACGTNPRAQRPAVQGASSGRPRWCRSCDERTRLTDGVDGKVMRCPACHPTSVAPWDVS
jgi:hypothetical protein